MCMLQIPVASRNVTQQTGEVEYVVIPKWDEAAATVEGCHWPCTVLVCMDSW